jgi:hypothetical protein
MDKEGEGKGGNKTKCVEQRSSAVNKEKEGEEETKAEGDKEGIKLCVVVEKRCRNEATGQK